MGGFFMMISKYNSLISCQTKETPPASMKQGFLWKGIWLILYIKNDYTCTYLKEVTGVMTQ